MSDAVPGPAGMTRLALPPVLDLAAADGLCRSLRDGFALDELELDGSAVERVSTPCLQLLLSAARSAAARGGRFRIAAPSDALTAAVAELGLGGLIPLEP